MTRTIVAEETLPGIGRPRIGVVGSSSASNHFTRALGGAGAADVVAFCAADRSAAERGASSHATAFDRMDDLLNHGVDGVIIASPTCEHVAQAEAAIERGIAVFCQRPLGRNTMETRRLIDAARNANVLLGVDMTFRATHAMRELRSTVQAGELGDIFAVDAVFHNAGVPENAWAMNPQMSGGGCMLDAGISLIDLTLWTLGFPRVTSVDSRLFANGERVIVGGAPIVAEDYATAMLDLDTGVTVNLACSWNLSAGQDARIEITFHGTESAGSFRNVDGSIMNFTSELFNRTHRHTLAQGADDWAGRTAVSWATALARGGRYDPWVEGVADVANTVDRVLGRHSQRSEN